MSYGVNAPQGLQPAYYLNGSPWTGQQSEYTIPSGYATSLFYGDPLYFAGNGTLGIANVAGPIMGVFVGVKYTDVNGNFITSNVWNANTVTQAALPANIYVTDDPNLLYDVQVTQGTNTINATDILKNANLNAGAGGSIRTSMSSWSLDQTTIATTANLAVKILRFTPNPKNQAGITYNNVLVLLNNNPLRSGGTGAAGV